MDSPVKRLIRYTAETKAKYEKLFWIFIISAFLGDIIETVFCWATMGDLMSRSSLIYGPFSVVWGIGAVVLTVTLHKLTDKNDRYIFVFGTVIGGGYEYLCSVVTEWMFGTVFWDYSHLPFNINGRINLLFCMFWGLFAVVWVKNIYPLLSRLIEYISSKVTKSITTFLIVLMVIDVILSATALARYGERAANVPAQGAYEQFLDRHYNNERIEYRYQNMRLVD